MNSKQIQAKVKKYFVDNPIVKTNGTYLHLIGWMIHKLAKLTALIPNFKRHKIKKLTLSKDLRVKLEKKFNRYLQLIQSQQDSDGFILSKHCDALEFSSLVSAAGVNVDIEKARDSDGFWHRRSVDNPCWPDNSKSTLSRDMLTGLMWDLYYNKRLDVAQSTLDHLIKHNFIIGKGVASRLILMPGLEAQLSLIVDRLGGKSSWFARHQSNVYPTKSLPPFAIHLSIISALLQIKLTGYATSPMVKSFKHHCDTQPLNPIYRFANALFSDGSLDSAAEILLEDSIWPEDRLPTRADVSSDWITQRDCFGPDWEPAKDDLKKKHSGGDFIFAAWLVLDQLRG